MNRKHRNTFRKISLVTAGAAVASLALLWSWNTLAPLFGGPTFELRHAVALLVAVIVFRIGLGRSAGHRRRGTEPEVHS